MIQLLKKILKVLEMLVEEFRLEYQERQRAAERQVWLDSGTVMRMLRVSERTLYNYVKSGKLICEKRGSVNYYLESSVLALMGQK